MRKFIKMVVKKLTKIKISSFKIFYQKLGFEEY